MIRGRMEVGFLSYKPNIYEFLYNVLCQISETWLFSDVAPVNIGQNLCFLFYKNAETKEYGAYKAITAVLKNNILSFILDTVWISINTSKVSWQFGARDWLMKTFTYLQ